MSFPNLGIGADLNGALPFSNKSVWNTPVDKLPLAANSAQIIAAISPGMNIKADFGSGLWQGNPIGIPYIVIDKGQPLVPFLETYWGEEGDDGPFPIPANAPIEGGSDRHVIVVERDPNAPNGLGKLYEVLYADFDPLTGAWSGQAAVFDLQGGDFQRPMGWTSADAAGLPVFPGLVRLEDVQNALEADPQNATLGHALRFTLSQANTAMAYVGAASHWADSIDGAAPFGMHVRLKADTPIPANATPEVRIIINTLKKYGMILADNGSDWYISGSPDERWDNDALQVLKTLNGGNFEVVDAAAVLAAASSGGLIEQVGKTIVGTPDDDNLPGTPYDDGILGLGGNDILAGGGGHDQLYGGAGRDQLKGSSGDDLLVGGVVLDRLYGGTGNDRLKGEGGSDVLVGGSGQDRLNGGAGRDLLKGESGDDLMVGGTDHDRLFGGTGRDQLRGDAGNDTLVGGSGRDQLWGGSGRDTFKFDTALLPGNADIIRDFSSSDDRIVLDDAVFKALALANRTGPALLAEEFRLGAGAQDADDRIIYDQTTGSLFYDADGNGAGAAMRFAVLANKALVTAADFYVG